jgi:hypothetical protein
VASSDAVLPGFARATAFSGQPTASCPHLVCGVCLSLYLLVIKQYDLSTYPKIKDAAANVESSPARYAFSHYLAPQPTQYSVITLEISRHRVNTFPAAAIIAFISYIHNSNHI